MFLSVIIAWVVATAFAFCGVVNAVGCIMEFRPELGALAFMEHFALAIWPLGVAAALVMLVQLATRLERWMLLWTMSQGSAPAPKQAATPAASPARPAAAAAAHHTPFSDHLQSSAARPAVAAQPPVRAVDVVQQAAPAPGGIPMPPKPTPRSAAPAPQNAAPEQPAQPETPGLSFFKLD